MRNVILMLVLGSAVLGAQQTAVRRTLVVRAHDPAFDQAVSLLGEDSGVNTKNGRRLADVTAPVCTAWPSGNGVAAEFPIAPFENASGSVALLKGWRSRAIDIKPEGDLAPNWTQLVAILEEPSSARADQWAQAYISLSSEEGFPDVKMVKGSKVISISECRTHIASSQPGSLVLAKASVANRGTLVYVLGYARLNGGLWVTFLGSSSDAADAPYLAHLFNSIDMTANQD